MGHVGDFGDNGQVVPAEALGRLPFVAIPVEAGDVGVIARLVETAGVDILVAVRLPERMAHTENGRCTAGWYSGRGTDGMKPRSGAFTLIELLVVIAITGLLFSILLPSLHSARASVRTVTCASNLKQLGVGWAMYADQSGGSIVPGRPGRFADPERNLYWVGNGYQYRPRWFVTLGAETGFYAFDPPSTDPADDNRKKVDGNRVYLDPEQPDRINNRNYAYGYNFQFLGNTRFKGGQESRGFINFPVTVGRINGATTVMAADALGTAAGKPTHARTDYHDDGTGDVFAVGNHGWSLDPPRLTDTSDYCDDNNRAPEHRSAPEMRHKGRANVLWCDGHAAAATYESLGYVERPNGSIAGTDENATNRFFSGTGRDDDPPPIN